MTDWTAVTESGTTWEYRHGLLRITRAGDERPDQVFTPLQFATLHRPTILRLAGGDNSVNLVDAFWSIVYKLPRAATPVVGLSIYASGINEWRLSTPVQSLTIHDDKEAAA